jgi:hypothetical protein
VLQSPCRPVARSHRINRHWRLATPRCCVTGFAHRSLPSCYNTYATRRPPHLPCGIGRGSSKAAGRPASGRSRKVGVETGSHRTTCLARSLSLLSSTTHSSPTETFPGVRGKCPRMGPLCSSVVSRSVSDKVPWGVSTSTSPAHESRFPGIGNGRAETCFESD